MDEKLRNCCDVLFVLPKLGDFGGVENSIYRISSYFYDEGYKVCILQTEVKKHIVPRDCPDEINVLSLIYRRSFGGLLDSFQALRIVRRCNRLKPKIIFISFERLLPYSLFFLDKNIKVFQFLRNDHESVFSRGLVNTRYLHGIVTNNNKVYFKLLNEFDLSNIFYIPNAVRVNKNVCWSDRVIDLIFVGRLVDESKGIFLLPEILKHIKNKNISLHIIGDGPDLELLKKKFIRNETIGQVIFYGSKSHCDVLELFRKAKIFIFTSRYEGMPNVLLESMAMGSVPFVLKLDGITDTLIENGKNGFIFDRDQLDVMASSIERYLFNSEELMSLSENAVCYVKQNLSVEEEKARMISLLKLNIKINKPIFDFTMLSLTKNSFVRIFRL